MKEEELVKMLAAIKLPTLEIQSHRRRLKMALEIKGYPEKRRFSITGLQIIRGVKNNMIRGLKSPQPIWKSLAFGLGGLALVVGITVTMLSSPLQPQVVMAAETVMISSDFSQASALGEYDMIYLKIDGVDTVIIHNENGNNVVTVNMEAREPTLWEIKRIGNTGLSKDEEQKAVDIVKSDARVQELLAQGASISKIVMEFTPYQGTLNSEIISGISKFYKNAAMVLIERGEDALVAYVDLNTGIVTRVKGIAR